MNPSRKLTVISFVGPSGSGKSTVMDALAEKYEVLEERYMELNRHQLDNRLMLSKWAYIQYWFDSVLQSKAKGVTLLLTDRCPLDTCAYVREGRSELLDVLTTAINELSALGISVQKVLVTAPFDILQTRIDLRLKIDTRRLNYNEADASHNRRAYDFYSENIQLWDRVIDTSIVAQPDLLALCESTIADLT
jgi:predicted ATPase